MLFNQWTILEAPFVPPCGDDGSWRIPLRTCPVLREEFPTCRPIFPRHKTTSRTQVDGQTEGTPHIPGSHSRRSPEIPLGRQGTSGVLSGMSLSLIHISEPTRQAEISYAVFCLK